MLCVFILLRGGNIPQPPHYLMLDDVELNRFSPYCIEAGSWNASEMLRSFPVDLLPLVPFSLEGIAPEIITELFEKLRQQSDPYLLGAAAEFASYVFDHYNKDQDWLIR